MRVTLPIGPYAKARPRVTRSHAYMPKAYMLWRSQFCALWRSAVPPIVFSAPRIYLRVDWVTKNGDMRPDTDNAFGAVMDAMQDAGVLVNDRFVRPVAGDVWCMEPHGTPCTLIHIVELTGSVRQYDPAAHRIAQARSLQSAQDASPDPGDPAGGLY